jgi:hypothetical protein
LVAVDALMITFKSKVVPSSGEPQAGITPD